MPATEPHREDGQQFLSFFFAGEEYATEILRIREVVEYQRLTPVPTTPPWVRGVMNLRGTVVPVLDLATKLQQAETTAEKLTCIVIFEVDLEGEPTPVGILIDEVGRVFELQEDEIHEPPAFGSPVRPDLLEGIGVVEDKPIPILHIQKVLTEDELAAAVAGTEALENDDGRSETPEKAGPPAPETEKPRAPKKPAKATTSKPEPERDAMPKTAAKARPKAKAQAKTGKGAKTKTKPEEESAKGRAGADTASKSSTGTPPATTSGKRPAAPATGGES